AEFRKILRQVANLRRRDGPARRFERAGDGIQVLDLGEEPRAALAFGDFLRLERFDLLRAALDRIRLRVAIRVTVRSLDHANVLEKESDAARLPQGTGLEQVA